MNNPLPHDLALKALNDYRASDYKGKPVFEHLLAARELYGKLNDGIPPQFWGDPLTYPELEQKYGEIIREDRRLYEAFRVLYQEHGDSTKTERPKTPSEMLKFFPSFADEDMFYGQLEKGWTFIQ